MKLLSIVLATNVSLLTIINTFSTENNIARIKNIFFNT